MKAGFQVDLASKGPCWEPESRAKTFFPILLKWFLGETHLSLGLSISQIPCLATGSTESP